MRTAVVALAIFAGLLAAAFAAPSHQLTVIREDGQLMWSLPVRPGGEVVLAYVNSIYGAPTEERLLLTPTGLTLIEVASTSQAVLAYNGLQAPYARRSPFYAAPVSAELPGLILRVGRTGRPILRVGRHELPLYTAGEGAQVRVEVTRR